MRKIHFISTLIFFVIGFVFPSCKKDSSDDYGSNAPRTNPMPAELTGQWNMTSSGTDYVYDGWHYGNSGRGININMKTTGTGWWNEIWLQATPTCVLVQNLSIDNTFELKEEDGYPMLYIYTTGGKYHGEGCTTVKDIVLRGDKIYPEFPPYKFYYKVASVDNNLSQKVLALSQEDDINIRFKKPVDTTMVVLKKQ